MSALSDKEKRKRQRLKDIQSFEIAFVPRGANQREFVVIKEDSAMKLDLSKLTASYEALGKVINVCKAGDLAPSAVEELTTELQAINTSLGAIAPQVDVELIKKTLAEMKVTVDTLHEQNRELSAQDHIDKLIELVENTKAQLEKIEAKPIAEDEGDGEDGEDDEEDADPPAVEEPVVAAPAEEEPAVSDPPAEEPVEEAAAPAPAPAPVVEDPAVEEEAQVEDVVTKADLTALGDTITKGFASAIVALAETLKAAPVVVKAAPATTHPSAAVSVDGRNNVNHEDDAAAWGDPFNFNPSEAT